MSYQVLARKWRPKDFSELVGQQQTAQALINALESQRLHHAYLFTGTRGVGKTTIARILSKSLNCEKGITANPCGECSSCVEISQGNFVDLLEIDAASKTKVEDTRELLDNVQYRPTRGRYKVYLIDEVHMLSGHSFNALLKTLEEPPPHVIFLLATTDPQKMPVTVLSRCLQFHLRRMEINEITGHLTQILEAEQIPCEKGALEPIAKGADGSMRDALSLLDQAIAYCGEEIKTQVVLDMLGSIDREYGFQLLDAIRANDAGQLIQVIENIAQFSPDFDELLSDWLSLLHALAVCQATGSHSDERIGQLAKDISAADLQLFYQLSLHAKRDLGYAPHPRQGFEMAMLRILAFKPATKPGATQPGLRSKNIPGALETSGGGATSEKAQSAQASAVETSASMALNNGPHTNLNAAQTTPQNTSRSASRNGAVGVQAVAQQVVEEGASAIVSEPEAKLEVSKTKLKVVVNNSATGQLQQQTNIENADVSNLAQSQETTTHQASDDNLDTTADSDSTRPAVEKIQFNQVDNQNWFDVVTGLTITGHGMQVLLNSTAEVNDGVLNISVLDKMEPLMTDSARQMINDGLQSYFEVSKLNLNFQFVDATGETPREKLARIHELALDEAEQTLLADPQIKFLLAQINGVLPRESIQLKN